MDTLTIREAVAADIPRVIDLAVESVLHSTSPYRNATPENVRQYRHDDLLILHQLVTDPNFKILMVYAAENFVGHAFLQLNHKDSATGELQAWIYDVSVRPEYWSRGVGKLLMQESERLARGLGIRAVGLGVTISNERAVKFYRDLGFLEERIQMVKLL
jgi:ribosomal protein S18 acetylase RimI-like enzyme